LQTALLINTKTIATKAYKGLIMSNDNVEVTEYNYTEKLETFYLNRSDENASVNCTNPLCANPNVSVKFDVDLFSCNGKETIGRDCKRSFHVKLVD
jgi:hypothetical protein